MTVRVTGTAFELALDVKLLVSLEEFGARNSDRCDTINPAHKKG